ncbi:Homocysteine S-methyltransferase [Trichodelitschia bisporula]|uniref:Homocysteine S-methyltransferase n=1 Tax=Trichodelitschia bisporula TaxID=703511 RepID=A0A6G1HYZ0_9PEZI|nr:Homocysteine S-methyltransferase [Trichodelitschia bisporula]
MAMDIVDFLRNSPLPILLDGALATELARRGYTFTTPLWSADALLHEPNELRRIHDIYYTMGANIAMTATYHASIKGLCEHAAVSEERARRLIHISVGVAKRARRRVTTAYCNQPMFIAGSVGPYGAFLANGSEYRGDYWLPEDDLKAFHRGRIEELLKAGVDMLFCEKMPSYEEVRVLFHFLADEFPEAKVLFSFTVKDADHLSDGTPLSTVAALFKESPKVLAIGVSCAPEALATAACTVLRRHTDKPLLICPNSGETYGAAAKEWSGKQPAQRPFHECVRVWEGLGIRFIGGCCRTTPDDIERLHSMLYPDSIGPVN